MFIIILRSGKRMSLFLGNTVDILMSNEEWHAIYSQMIQKKIAHIYMHVYVYITLTCMYQNITNQLA